MTASTKSRARPAESKLSRSSDELRQRAEARLRENLNKRRFRAKELKSVVDIQRVVHELQVHEVELEMQNLELRAARDKMEALVEKYTDLYDFAPVGYFSLDATGRILEVNLSGAALLGVERSRLLNQRLPQFIVPTDRPAFLLYLKQVLGGTKKRVCEARLRHADQRIIWAGFHAVSAASPEHPAKWCRVTASDLTVLKQAEEAQRRAEALAAANEEANREIARRAQVEIALRLSGETQSRLLAESRGLHAQLRQMTRRILEAQEEERKTISRELHDEVAQILAGINVELASLTGTEGTNPKEMRRRIAHAQKLVGQSIAIVHRFARNLRPTLLDDLGLLPALRAYIRELNDRRGLHIDLTASPGIEDLDSVRRTVLYRVAQEALTNVVRHAHAHLATVEVRKTPGAVLLEVRDDGKSFPVERLLAPSSYKRLGLLGMRERVEMVGGTFSIVSAPGRGTTVSAEVPYPPPHKSK